MNKRRPSRSPEREYVKNDNYTPSLTVILAIITTVSLGYFFKNMNDCDCNI
jgi:hypothetical protein